MPLLRKILSSVALLFCVFSLWAQESQPPQDSVFRLVQADLARQIETYGTHYRIAQGNAKFFHNDTYFLCDSASWNVEAQRVEAYGNVKVLQEGTMLQSERMTYDASDNTARFRGSLVELFDKEKNTLRTEWLDYNTRDSVAVFEGGGAMMSADSCIVESNRGRYEAKERLFHFYDDVQVWMDSVVLYTERMDYNSDEDRAYFFEGTKAWKDSGFVSAQYGWYDRPKEKIHFALDVYMNDPTYEAWAGKVYYDKPSGEINMFENAQVLDTTRKSYYTADHIRYEQDSVAGRVTMSLDPSIIYCGTNDSGEPDTLYVRADSLFVYSRYKCDIPKDEIDEAARRVEDILFDSLSKKREEQAAERAKAAEEAMQAAGKLPPAGLRKPSQAQLDSLSAQMPADTLAAPADTLVAAPDTLPSLPPPPDSTEVRYVLGYHHMRAFRSDIQASCDSVVFCELDSIARLFGSPVLWNEVKNQLTSQTMQILMKDGRLHRGSLLDDAWIISQVDSVYFNQIKSTEMLGYFHDDDLYRYDALGGVNALFFMQDGSIVTTANLKEAKSLSAMIKDGNARRLLYNDQIKSDAYPVLDLPKEKMYLKDFEWRGKERPATRGAVTEREPKISQREDFAPVERPTYPRTERFFNVVK